MGRRENVQLLRSKRHRALVCVKCRQDMPEGDKCLLCPDCRKEQGERVKALHEKRIAQGICIQCGKAPALPGKKQCIDCKEYHRHHSAMRYHNLADKRCCTQCAQKLPDDWFRVKCPLCTEKAYMRKRLDYQRKKATANA